MAVNRRHPQYHLLYGKGGSRNRAVTCSAGSQHIPRCKADIPHCPQSRRDSRTMLHRRGKKGSVQQKREGHAVGRAGCYSIEPSKVNKYKFTGRQTSPKFYSLQVKGDTFCVLWHIFPGPLTSAMPSLLFLWHTYTHFTYSVCLLTNDPILHHSSTSMGLMQWCKTLGYHYNDKLHWL